MKTKLPVGTKKRRLQYNVALLLTALRLLLAPFVFWAFAIGHYSVGFAMFLFTRLTDILDGYFARKYNLQTEFGGMLDQVADRLVMSAIAAGIVLNAGFPVLLFLLFFLRDILITCGAVLALRRGKVIPAPTSLSMFTTFIQFSAFLSYLVHFAVFPVFSGAVILTGLSILQYVRKNYYS